MAIGLQADAGVQYMHFPRVLWRAINLTAIITVIAIAVMTAGSRSNSRFSPHEKAFYADAATINFVRPGLIMKVLSANIASDGTITANISVTDPVGVALDRLGVTTPGAVSISCVAAYIPQGQTQYTAYTTRVQTSPITKVSATQAGTDSGGTWTSNADGTYTYKFGTKAPSGFDQTVTHTVGCQASRDLSAFNLGINYAEPTTGSQVVYSWVPNGSKVTVTRDVIRTQSCNKCHDKLAFHGGSRRGLEYCVLCHQPQTTDPDTGNTVDMKVMAHKIHMGANLPSVKAGGSYQIIGFNQGVSDWSTVQLPSDPGNCQVCHEQTTGAAQAKAFYTPSRAACGACHDDVNFATGQNHVSLPQVTDASCSTCHTPQGELPLDASILGAHIPRTNGGAINPGLAPFIPGMVFDSLKVQNGTAGSKPTISFTLKDSAGNAIPLASLKTSPNRIAAVMAGPTTDYGYTNFGSDVTSGGYVSEDVTTTGACDQNGNCQYTFAHAVPANAKGTFAIGLEGRRGLTVLPNTTITLNTEYGAKNVVAYFSVDGSQVTPRRQVVDLAKCNQCHTQLSLHGTNRNQIEMCVLCHNPSETDAVYRPSASNATDKATPPQTVEFAFMIHRIHTGDQLPAMGADYTVVGFGGSHNDFTEVRYPAFSPSGAVGDRRNCDMCHVNNSEQNLPAGLNAVKKPQGPVNPLPSTAAACTGCHADLSSLAHTVANTVQISSQTVESCNACHKAGAEFNVSQVHAQ
jgi:OmcA/MtrC family decaheme c-type cytochrome